MRPVRSMRPMRPNQMRDRFALFDIELAPRPNEPAGAGEDGASRA